QLAPGGRVEDTDSARVLGVPSRPKWGVPSPSSVLGFAGLLVMGFGDRAGLPEWLRLSAFAALLTASAILYYRERRQMKPELAGDLVAAAAELGFGELKDPGRSFAALGLDRAPAFRGHRVRWAFEREASTGKTILAGAIASLGSDSVQHHIVSCWSLAGSP